MPRTGEPWSAPRRGPPGLEMEVVISGSSGHIVSLGNQEPAVRKPRLSLFKAHSSQGPQQWASLAWWISPWCVAEGTVVASAVVQDNSFLGAIWPSIHGPVPYHMLLGSRNSSVLVRAKETLRGAAQHPSVLVVSPWTCLPGRSLAEDLKTSGWSTCQGSSNGSCIFSSRSGITRNLLKYSTQVYFN